MTLSSEVVISDSSVALPKIEPYCQWQVTGYAIEEPLCGYSGDTVRGKAIVTDGNKGNCLACHRFPIEGVEAYGNIGPPLDGVGSRLSKGYIRLKVVDARNINPLSIMPGFYRHPDLINRPAEKYKGRTFLNTQQIEDVIAYLQTLK